MDIYQNIYSDSDDKYIKKNIEFVSAAAQNHGIFMNELPQQLDGHIKEIHDLLNGGKWTREQGVRQLLDVVGQCSQQTLQAQGERWFRLCTQAMISASTGRGKTDACRILLQILHYLPEVPDVQRVIISKPPVPLILVLAAADPSWNCAALECLCEYLKIAPGQCLSHKVGVEKHILRYLDIPIGRTGHVARAVRWAGTVYATLPLPGGGGAGKQGQLDARACHLSSLLALAHSLMDHLFEGIIENESYDHTRESGLNLGGCEQGGNPTGTHLQVVTRLLNTLTFIGAFLTSPTNPALTINPHNLFSIIFRILQVESSVLMKYRGQEYKLVAFLMPLLHQHALMLLTDILYSVGEGVDLYLGPLIDLLAMLIKSSGSEDGTEIGGRTRLVGYATLVTLLQVSKGRNPPPPALITQIIKDFMPTGRHLTLQKRKKPVSLSLSIKGKKKKGHNIGGEVNCGSLASKPLVHLDQLCAIAYTALQLTRATLTYTSHTLHHQAQQQLQSALVNVAGCVVGPASTRRPNLYSQSLTRVALVEALSALASSPNPRWPPPYTLLTDLFSAGLADEDVKVANACQVGLDSIRIVAAHPQLPVLSQACQHHSHTTDHQDEEDNELENGQLSPAEDDEEEEEQEKGEAEVSVTEERMEDEQDKENGDDEDKDDEQEESEQEEEEESEEEEASALSLNGQVEEEEEEEDQDKQEEAQDQEEEDLDQEEEEDDLDQEEEEENLDQEEEEETTDKALNTLGKAATEKQAKTSERQAVMRSNKQTKAKKRKLKKRQLADEAAKTQSKKKKATDYPSLEVMLATFVNSNPDD